MGNPTTRLPPLRTGSDTSPLPSVHFNENVIVSATWDKVETPLFCHARVTILVHLVHPMGNPTTPLPPLMTDSDYYLLPTVHFNVNWIV